MQGVRQNHAPLTAESREGFLEGLRAGLTIRDSAALVDRERRSFYRLRERDREFATAWDEAFSAAHRVGIDTRPKRSQRQGCIYFIGADDGLPVKIGFTAFDVDVRLAEFQAYCPVTLRVLGTVSGTRALERELHARFAQRRRHGEWFAISHAEVRALL